MGAGGRRRQGGGGGGGSNQRMLKQLVNSYKKKFATADEIARHLEQHPNYRRTGLRNLTRLVSRILDSSSASPSSSRHRLSFEDEDADVSASPSQSRKRSKRIDGSEERLQQIENDYPKRIKRNRSSSASSGSDSESPASSSAVSTSEDAIYGENLKPEFDLMQSMLRDRYAAESKQKEKNIEVDVATNKTISKIDILIPVNGEADGGSGVPKTKEKASKTAEVNGKDGPTFRDLGGMQPILEELEMEVFVPLFHPHVLRRLGVNPISGILLHGPPGCGKTKLAQAIANETGVPFYMISATELVSGVSGASEENIRELFTKAYRTAPSIIFIDEIDSIASKRESLQREMERRIVTQLMTCMDQYHTLLKPTDSKSVPGSSDENPGYVLVIGATNRPDAIDPALRRPGRFDREIRLGVPDENARVDILRVLTEKCTLEGSLDLLQIARSTPGFVGADLHALVSQAGNLATRSSLVQRKIELTKESADKECNEKWWKIPWLPEDIEKLAISMKDFEQAAKLVQPSSRREGFSSVPDVKWEEVGGLEDIRKEFDLHIIRRIKYPEDYEKFGVNSETGILLYGPPGCGKTLIAKAVANAAGANFIHIKGPELLSKYVGESEQQVRTLFTRARTCSPCVIFFDEVESLTTTRGKEGAWVVERALNQLLIELDGADQRSGVFVIGATNRPDEIDPAMLRPGRFGKILYVPLPSAADRVMILKALVRGKPIDSSVDLNAIANMEACNNLSGADLNQLVNDAALAATVEKMDNPSGESSGTIKATHFEEALRKISPSVMKKELHNYKVWSERFRRS